MDFYWLVIGALAVWRVTHLLAAEDGPFDLMVRLRRRAGTGFWGSLLDCFYCLSLWVAVPFAWLLGEDWKERAMLWPALSGVGILLERLTGRKQTSAPFIEDEEQNDAMLRGQEKTDHRDAAQRR